MSNDYTLKADRLEAWVIKNSNWLALGIIAVAGAIRLTYAASCYLNPDEAQHYLAARSSGWIETIKAALMLAHPPLFILVLHGILFLGTSELILRLPSILAGTAALSLAFAWMRRTFTEIAALAGLGFMALSPEAISASTEVRQYGLLLFFVCGALYAMERMFSERSVTWAIVEGLFLLGALLTHYTTIVLLASLGLYLLLRVLQGGVPRNILFALGASQLVLATVLGGLYFGQIRRAEVFHPSAGSLEYLQHYYEGGRETLLGFLGRALSGTFYYAVGPRPLAILLMAMFAAGLAAMFACRTNASRITALLVLFPFIAGFVAAVFRVFPFAGSRHQTYLLPFMAAGISAAIAWFPRGLAARLLVLGVVIAPVWVVHSAPENDLRVMPKSVMTAAIKYVGRTVPRGEPLFADDMTRDDLRYYLARNETSLGVWHTGAGDEERIDGYLVVVPEMHLLVAFRPEDLVEEVRASARALGVPDGAPLWIVSAAWKEPSLASRLPAGADHDVKKFGQISVVRVIAGKS